MRTQTRKKRKPRPLSPRYAYRNPRTNSENISERDWSHLRHAARVSIESDHKFRHGAVVVKGGRVLSFGFNVEKISPDTPSDVFSTHAEIRAGKGASQSEGATIYVARVATDGSLSIAMPCKHCHLWLRERGFSRVVFSIESDIAGSYRM